MAPAKSRIQGHESVPTLVSAKRITVEQALSAILQTPTDSDWCCDVHSCSAPPKPVQLARSTADFGDRRLENIQTRLCARQNGSNRVSQRLRNCQNVNSIWRAKNQRIERIERDNSRILVQSGSVDGSSDSNGSLRVVKPIQLRQLRRNRNL